MIFAEVSYSYAYEEFRIRNKTLRITDYGMNLISRWWGTKIILRIRVDISTNSEFRCHLTHLYPGEILHVHNDRKKKLVIILCPFFDKIIWKFSMRRL